MAFCTATVLKWLRHSLLGWASLGMSEGPQDHPCQPRLQGCHSSRIALIYWSKGSFSSHRELRFQPAAVDAGIARSHSSLPVILLGMRLISETLPQFVTPSSTEFRIEQELPTVIFSSWTQNSDVAYFLLLLALKLLSYLEENSLCQENYLK